VRKAVFKGSFYPSNKNEIINFFKNVKCLKKRNAHAAIVPHAGYIYSGKTAFKTLCSINIPNTVIIFCPNHRGLGYPISISPDKKWETPFGPVEVDMELGEKIEAFEHARFDSLAHMYEHSLEVQLPILKMLHPEVKMVPVSIGTGDRDILNKFSSHIFRQTSGIDILYLASSDMSHYVPADYASKYDGMVIEALEQLNVDLAFELVNRYDISMCGIYAAYVAVKCGKMNGANKGEVIEYTNSGVVTGDFNEVVAYLGMIFT